MMRPAEYSKRLESISPEQFQAALDHFGLGQFVNAEAIPFGLFGQNVFVTSSTGEYVFRGSAHYDWQFPKEQFVAKLPPGGIYGVESIEPHPSRRARVVLSP